MDAILLLEYIQAHSNVSPHTVDSSIDFVFEGNSEVLDKGLCHVLSLGQDGLVIGVHLCVGDSVDLLDPTFDLGDFGV